MQTPKSRNSNIPSKDWMDLARYSKEYIAGVESFLDFPYSYGDPQGYNLASHVDASSAQVVRGTNLPHSSRSDLNPVIQKVFCI
ncbi:hypothetical protein KY290_036785 [Solanum tuberosum]|uniref:Uncharacterized protein n=1 Tax=Solanum tuberosum TaxID=4113 RepID=A0ABQ7TXH7_SOLTU|nr:hypothetical protein KY290_036785 [Solanum tuberosum]